MINNPELIKKVIEDIKQISKEDLDWAIREIEKEKEAAKIKIGEYIKLEYGEIKKVTDSRCYIDTGVQYAVETNTGAYNIEKIVAHSFNLEDLEDKNEIS